MIQNSLMQRVLEFCFYGLGILNAESWRRVLPLCSKIEVTTEEKESSSVKFINKYRAKADFSELLNI